MTMIKEKIESAEAIRGVACLFVIFSHLSLSFFPSLHYFFNEPTPTQSIELWIHNSPFAFWYSGTAAVYIFFVLSGFVLTYSIVNSRDPVQKIKAMSLKRYPRLMIPAFVSCVLLWAAYTLFDPDSTGMTSWASEIGNVTYPSLQHALYEGSIGSFLFGNSEYNWVLWTMKIEFFGSFGLFFLLYLMEKKKVFYWLIPIATIVLCFKVDYLGYAAFLIGSLFYLNKKKIPNLVAAACLILGLYFAGVHNDSTSYQWFYNLLDDHTYEILNFLSGPFIVISILGNQKLSEMITNQLTIYLGKLSFSAYLSHLLILYVVGIPLFGYLTSLEISYTLAALISCISVLLVTIGFSEIYFRLVDKTAIKVSSKIANLFTKA
ncbi:acyltransferase family protein [Aquirhabdus sp.]|uniref:acyltransferase family protein n=1 Tax=Aquirhabdus sp. TaxID=2824160 RepID=UPI00396C6B35